MTSSTKTTNRFSEGERSRIIEMAWEDRTPFEAIEDGFGLAEKDVIGFMRRNLKPASFRLWRKRVIGRATKHKKFQRCAPIPRPCSQPASNQQGSTMKTHSSESPRAAPSKVGLS